MATMARPTAMARAATAAAAGAVATRVAAATGRRAAIRSGSSAPSARRRRRDRAADQHGARQGLRLPRSARRGLRLPARQRLPGQPRRRLHPRQADPPVRAAQGRLRHRPQPTCRSQREEPGDARDPLGQRRRSRQGQDAVPVRRPHCVVPRREVAAREPVRSQQHDGAHHRPDLARSARVSAASSCRRPRPARPRS